MQFLSEKFFNEAVESLQRMIRIKSVEGKAKEGMPFGEGPLNALHEMLSIGKELGFRVYNHKNMAGHIEMGPDTDEYIGIVAHLDVVPEGSDWIYPPYGAEIHDGFMYGRGTVDDKGHYAKEMCIEKMCEEEPYGIVEEGYLEDLDEITPETLYQQYQNLLSYSLVDIVVEGTMDFDRTVGFIQKYFSFPTERSFVLKNEVVAKTVETVKEYEETMDIEQGKLVMGFRTNRSIRDDDYYALLMYSVILGNGSFSKLFRVVREKYSLCYSIGTSLEKLKGIMFIQTGIDSKNKAQVMRLIQEQMKEMEMKNISEEEILQGKKLVINGFKSVKDSVMGLCDFYYFQTLHGNEKSIEEIIDSIQSVTVEEIAKVAHDIQLDTIFFLRERESPHSHFYYSILL